MSATGQGLRADTPQAELKMRWKGQVIIPGVVIVGVLLFGAREPILLTVGNFLVIQDRLQPADMIHVIAGPDDRADYAIQLYKQGCGKTIFFTGGWYVSHGYYHGQHGAERAEAQGIELESVSLPDTGRYPKMSAKRRYGR